MINSYVSILRLSAKPHVANMLNTPEVITNLYSQFLLADFQLRRDVADCRVIYESSRRLLCRVSLGFYGTIPE
jgi:hypothetical protein